MSLAAHSVVTQSPIRAKFAWGKRLSIVTAFYCLLMVYPPRQGTIALAQGIPTNPVTSPELTTGIQAYSTLSSDSEQVNLANGNVSVSIPLLSLPGISGTNLNLSVNYNSKNVSLYSHYQTGYWGYLLNWASNEYTPDFAGGTLSIPRLNFTYDLLAFAGEVGEASNPTAQPVFAHERFYFTDSQGTKHTFANQRDVTNTTDLSVNASYLPIDVSDSIDGSFMRLDTSHWPIVKVYQKDGEIITFNIPTQYQTMGSAAIYAPGLYPSSISDRNGNTITFVATGPGLTITDTLGTC